MSSSAQVLTTLRKQIMDGEYAPGSKLAEIPIAEQLGVSRTPVRLAFRTLEQEGLLQKGEKRGYVIREFTASDVQCALEVRGALEGLAVRRLAERGLDDAVRQILEECIAEETEVLSKGYLTEADVEAWSRINGRFHRTIIDASRSAPLADAIARNNHLPFASVDSLIIDLKDLNKEYKKLSFAHLQHQILLDAIITGEGARAEMLMREHAYVGLRYESFLTGN